MAEDDKTQAEDAGQAEEGVTVTSSEPAATLYFRRSDGTEFAVREGSAEHALLERTLADPIRKLSKGEEAEEKPTERTTVESRARTQGRRQTSRSTKASRAEG